MKDFRPYLQHDFNMAKLSVMVNIPVHHLAYYFREVKKISFTDFRNRWRVDHAKKLICEGKSKDLTLEAIGILSGFSSRNTFLNAFKKAEGISPSAYLSQINMK
jgi:AraC-like DNA-binding protein